jgi:hypothetical protein
MWALFRVVLETTYRYRNNKYMFAVLPVSSLKNNCLFIQEFKYFKFFAGNLAQMIYHLRIQCNRITGTKPIKHDNYYYHRVG